MESAAKYLRPGVSNIQVVQRDILHYLLLFVHVAFGQRHVLLCLQVKLCGKRVTASLSLQGEQPSCVRGTQLKLNVHSETKDSTGEQVCV